MELNNYNVAAKREAYAKAKQATEKRGDWYQMWGDYKQQIGAGTEYNIETALWKVAEGFYAPSSDIDIAVMNEIAMPLLMWHWIFKDCEAGGKVSSKMLADVLAYAPPKESDLWPILANVVPAGNRAAITVHVDGVSVSPGGHSIAFSKEKVSINHNGKSYEPLWSGIEFIRAKETIITSAVCIAEIGGKEHKVYVGIPPSVPTNLIKNFASAYVKAAKKVGLIGVESDICVGLATLMKAMI